MWRAAAVLGSSFGKLASLTFAYSTGGLTYVPERESAVRDSAYSCRRAGLTLTLCRARGNRRWIRWFVSVDFAWGSL